MGRKRQEGAGAEDLQLSPELKAALEAAAEEAAGKPLQSGPNSPLARVIGMFVEETLKAEMQQHLGTGPEARTRTPRVLYICIPWHYNASPCGLTLGEYDRTGRKSWRVCIAPLASSSQRNGASDYATNTTSRGSTQNRGHSLAPYTTNY